MIRNINRGPLEQIITLLEQIVDEIKAIMVVQALLDHLLSNCGQHIPATTKQRSYNNKTTILQHW